MFDFFHQCLIVFGVFSSLGRFIPRYFILFDVMVNGIASLISLSGFHCWHIEMQQISVY